MIEEKLSSANKFLEKKDRDSAKDIYLFLKKEYSQFSEKEKKMFYSKIDSLRKNLSGGKK